MIRSHSTCRCWSESSHIWILLAFSHNLDPTSKISALLYAKTIVKSLARRITEPILRSTEYTSDIAIGNSLPNHQMSALPASALGRPHSSAGSTSNAPVSPVSSKGKRKRVHDLHSSPGSGEDGYEAANGERKRKPGVKSNECRQQKVRSTTRVDNAA